MTKLLAEAVAQARELPAEEQDELAVTLLAHMREDADYALTPEQVEEVKRRKQEFDEGRGSFATDEEMEAFWKKCGL